LLTFAVFGLLVWAGVAPVRFLGVAVWEGVGAVATGVGLWWDKRRIGNQAITAMGAGG